MALVFLDHGLVERFRATGDAHQLHQVVGGILAQGVFYLLGLVVHPGDGIEGFLVVDARDVLIVFEERLLHGLGIVEVFPLHHTGEEILEKGAHEGCQSPVFTDLAHF